MKYTIEGFNQEYALSLKKTEYVKVKGELKPKLLKLDCIDLVILRWFVDFYPNMDKKIIDGCEYAWLSHNKLVEDLPLCDISKRAFIERMQKMVSLGILKYKLVKTAGTFSYYTYGAEYINLVSTHTRAKEEKPKEENKESGVDVPATEGTPSNDTGYTLERDRGIRSNDIGYNVETYNKDKSIKDSSINYSSIKIKEKEILNYLNKKTGKDFELNNSNLDPITHLLDKGYSLPDFISVIDKKCKDWLGTDFEQYLRPSTLFGAKFEQYLNQKYTFKKGNKKSYQNYSQREYSKEFYDGLYDDEQDTKRANYLKMLG